MRLFAYYIGHTFVNAIKKMMKTWLAFMLIIMVFGGVVGGIAGTVASSVEDRKQTETALDTDAIQEGVEAITGEAMDEDMAEMIDFSMSGPTISMEVIIELAISGLFFLMLFLSLFNSKGLGEIFQPADVVMLFSAPIKPQSVMLFRLSTALGMQVVFSLIMAFQLPNLILNAGMSVWSAVTLIIDWVMLSLLTTLLQVLLYVASSHSEFLKEKLKMFVGLLFALLAAGFIYSVFVNDKSLLSGAVAMFTGEGTYWIPFWGWFRGFTICAVEGDNLRSFMFLGFCVLGLVALFVVIWNLKVDYYEDAVVATEKKAALIEKSKNSSNGLGVVREKERSDKIKRDGFEKGSGAGVFFYKTLYNRQRLGVFKGITKTMLTYLVICAAIVILGTMKDFAYTFPVLCGTLVFIAFYRTLGNPLREDIGKEFFLMIPASAFSKLGFSILGGTVNTLLDLILPYVISVVYLKVSPLEAVLWLLFILSVDAYGTVVGSFIQMSVPISLPDAVQKMVQIMFIYFGILPAIVFVIVGLVLDMVYFLMPIGIVVNLLLTALFIFVTAKMMESGRK